MLNIHFNIDIIFNRLNSNQVGDLKNNVTLIIKKYDTSPMFPLNQTDGEI